MGPPRTDDSAIEIRAARPGEFETIGDLVVEAYERLEAPVMTPVHLAYLEHIRDVAARAASCTVLVAVEDGGRILGSVTYVPGPGNPYAELERDGEAGFRMLGVLPAAQGCGIGRRLVQACVDRARAQGCTGIAISTTPAMEAAHHLYERLGFVRDPERDWSPGAGIQLMAYALDLRLTSRRRGRTGAPRPG